MINLSECKDDINVSLSAEREFLANYHKFQERINNNIYMILRKLVNNKLICSLEQSKDLYKNLSNVVKCLNMSNQNMKAIR